jgi:DNA polymerase I
MIINHYYPEDNWDVGSPHLYLRYRGKDGALVVRTIDPNHAHKPLDYVPPHCWIPVDTHPRKLSRVTARYPGLKINDTIQATGIDQVKLMRLDVPNPSLLYEVKKELQTYEADIPYEDQVMIHMYPNTKEIPEFHPRIWYFDMEWQPQEPHEGAITMIAIDDTHADEPVIFAWNENTKETEVDHIERESGYMRYLYSNEEDMLTGFLEHLNACDPDMLVAHAMMWADLPKLVERLGRRASLLSPLKQVLRPNKKGYYKEISQPILGRLCYDTALPWMEGSGLEAMWHKSGRGTFRSKKLASIAEDLELDKEFGEEGVKMNADVFTWWVENFDEFVDYCVRDTTLLRKCSERIKAIPYHLAMQKYCGIPFKSTCKVSRYIRGLISRKTDLKAKTSYNRKRNEYRAATVPDTIGGRWEKVACIDFKSMYPSIFVDANLCPTTKRYSAGENIRSVPNGTHWDTTSTGIIPSVIQGMLELRAEYKKLLKEAKTDEEKLQYDMMQTAVKVATNAAYGYVSQKEVGGAWIDPDIGATITYYGRQCIETLLIESDKAGYKALAGHTDSGYIQIPFDKTEEHLAKLNNYIQKKYDLPNMEIELEAYFDYWLTADVKNQNFGIMVWPPEKKGHLKVTGFSYKASIVSPLTKEIQGQIFQMIGTGAEEDEVTAFIRPIAKEVLAGERTVEQLAPYGRIGQDEYQRAPPMAVRGAYYYNDHINSKEPFRTGDSLQWIYTIGTPDDKPHTLVVGFRDASEISDYHIDYGMCVDKFIKAKIKNIYRVLDWDLNRASGAPMPKKHW